MDSYSGVVDIATVDSNLALGFVIKTGRGLDLYTKYKRIHAHARRGRVPGLVSRSHDGSGNIYSRYRLDDTLTTTRGAQRQQLRILRLQKQTPLTRKSIAAIWQQKLNEAWKRVTAAAHDTTIDAIKKREFDSRETMDVDEASDGRLTSDIDYGLEQDEDPIRKNILGVYINHTSTLAAGYEHSEKVILKLDENKRKSDPSEWLSQEDTRIEMDDSSQVCKDLTAKRFTMRNRNAALPKVVLSFIITLMHAIGIGAKLRILRSKLIYWAIGSKYVKNYSLKVWFNTVSYNVRIYCTRGRIKLQHTQRGDRSIRIREVQR